jgi:hypothetical protein
MSQTLRAPLGDEIWTRAGEASHQINHSEFMTSLRKQDVSASRYAGFIASVYPIVVGFNRALIRSIPKIDNVRDAWLVKGMADQLKEEQIHNDMWRAMLEVFTIDHMAMWDHLREYLQPLGKQGLDETTRNVIAAISEDPDNLSPGCFPDARFPEPVLALFHHMYSIADSDLSFWAHFSSQSAIEATIYGFVSESVYPGVIGNPELDKGARSTVWWKEHAKQGGSKDHPSTEEKHLHIARTNLNRSRDATAQIDEILRATEDSLLLFSAAVRWHHADRCGQWSFDEFLLK